MVNKPKITSKANVLKIILNKILTLSWANDVETTSARAVTATKKQTINIGVNGASSLEGTNKPMANNIAKGDNDGV